MSDKRENAGTSKSAESKNRTKRDASDKGPAADANGLGAEVKLWDTIRNWILLIAGRWAEILTGALLSLVVLFALVKLQPTLARIIFCDIVDCKPLEKPGPPGPGPGSTPVPAPTPKPVRHVARIVVFDTATPSEAYSKELSDNGETNAHFVADRLRLAGYSAIPAIIGRDQSSREHFLEPAPDLVVVHRSTFQSPSKNRDNEIELLIATSPKQTRFLIYSRSPGTDIPYAQDLEKRSGASGRVSAITLAERNPWSNLKEVGRLLDAVRRQLPPDAVSSPQARD